MAFSSKFGNSKFEIPNKSIAGDSDQVYLVYAVCILKHQINFYF